MLCGVGGEEFGASGLRLGGTVGIPEQGEQSGDVVGGAQGVEVAQRIVVDPAVTQDVQLIGDGADLSKSVVEGEAEAAEAFGEHAQLALQVGA